MGRKVHPPLRDVSMGVCAFFLHSPKMLPIWFLSQHIISGSMCVCRYAADRWEITSIDLILSAFYGLKTSFTSLDFDWYFMRKFILMVWQKTERKLGVKTLSINANLNKQYCFRCFFSCCAVCADVVRLQFHAIQFDAMRLDSMCVCVYVCYATEMFATIISVSVSNRASKLSPAKPITCHSWLKHKLWFEYLIHLSSTGFLHLEDFLLPGTDHWAQSKTHNRNRNLWDKRTQNEAKEQKICAPRKLQYANNFGWRFQVNA